MPEPVSLLASPATPLMRALSRVSAARRPIASALADLWDPWACPPAALAYLARSVGVALWDDSWPVARRRAVISQTISLSRRRGTRPAFDGYLAMADATVFDFRAPPQVLAPRPSRTQAERDAWAAQFAELRVYPFRTNHVRATALFPGRPWDKLAPNASEATAYAGRRAVLIDGGIETPVAIQAVSGPNGEAGFSQVALTGKGRRFVLGRPLGGLNAIPLSSTARSRLFTFGDGQAQPDLLVPGLTPLDVVPKRTSVPAQRKRALIPGVPWFGSRRFTELSPAPDRVFDSYRLYDATRAATGQLRPRGGWILGRGVLGQPAFEIDLAVDLARTVSRRVGFPTRYGVLRAHDPRPMANVLAAVRAAKLGRDQVLVRTGIYRPIQIGDALTADGTFTVGQTIRSL